MTSIFKALADDHRLRLIHLLSHGELCVCDIEAVLDMSQSNVSKHLSKLRQAGLVEKDKRAQWVYYHLSSDFTTKHQLLYAYLLEQFEEKTLYVRDNDRLRTHKSNQGC